MGDSSSDEDERPAARAAPTSFLSGPELLPSLIIDESEAAPVRRSSWDRGLERTGGGLGEGGRERHWSHANGGLAQREWAWAWAYV